MKAMSYYFKERAVGYIKLSVKYVIPSWSLKSKTIHVLEDKCFLCILLKLEKNVKSGYKLCVKNLEMCPSTAELFTSSRIIIPFKILITVITTQVFFLLECIIFCLTDF